MGRTITMAVQGQGSTTIPDAQVIAGLLKELTDIELRLVPENDVNLRLSWLKEGKVDFFYEGSRIPVRFEGSNPGEIARSPGVIPMNIVASAHSGASGFMVRADSPIKTIYDIGPRTRVAVGPVSSEFVYALLAWLKLNRGPIPEDPSTGRWNVDLIRLDDRVANLRSVFDGVADVACVQPDNPTVKEGAERPPGVRFLELPTRTDPEGMARFLKVVPYRTLSPAPELGVRAMWGLITPTGTACVWCRPDFDERLAYEMTKWLAVNYDLYKDKGHRLKTYTLANLKLVADTAMAPVHPGTVRYLREKGLWSPANNVRQTYTSRLMGIYCQTWEAAVARADATGVAVTAGNPAWIRLWADCKKKAGLPPIRPLNDAEIIHGLDYLDRLSSTRR